MYVIIHIKIPLKQGIVKSVEYIYLFLFLDAQASHDLMIDPD